MALRGARSHNAPAEAAPRRRHRPRGCGPHRAAGRGPRPCCVALAPEAPWSGGLEASSSIPSLPAGSWPDEPYGALAFPRRDPARPVRRRPAARPSVFGG